MNYIDKVHKVVRRIPKGKVATYGQIAQIIKKSKFKNQNDNVKFKINPRMVGRALHQNPDPEKIPCHRIVDRNGRIAQRYAFGGAEAQRERLLAEGIRFQDETHVDLEACLW